MVGSAQGTRGCLSGASPPRPGWWTCPGGSCSPSEQEWARTVVQRRVCSLGKGSAHPAPPQEARGVQGRVEGRGGQGPSLLFQPQPPLVFGGPSARSCLHNCVPRGLGRLAVPLSQPAHPGGGWGSWCLAPDRAFRRWCRRRSACSCVRRRSFWKDGLGLAPSSRCSLLGRAPRHQSGLLGWAGTDTRSVQPRR